MMSHETTVTNDWETIFVNKFIVRNKRERVASQLAQGGKRMQRFLSSLYHFSDFVPSMSESVPLNHRNEQVSSRLIQLGAPSVCHVVSQYKDFDGLNMDLNEALDAIVGRLVPAIVICVPEMLAYYEAERPEDRLILRTR